MKYGELIKKAKWVLICIHTDWSGINRDLLTDLQIEYELFIGTINTSGNDAFLVNNLKQGNSKVEFLLYQDGVLQCRVQADNCNHLEKMIEEFIV